MGLQERLQEIRVSHGQHTGRKCEVCWMLDELSRQNADTRAIAADIAMAKAEAADKALRLAEIERDAALASAISMREYVDELAQRLDGTMSSALMARDLATHELSAAKQAAAGANNARRELGIQHMQFRTAVTAVLADMAALPQIPRVRQLAAKLRAALEGA